MLSKRLLVKIQQAAVGVMDDHDLLRSQVVMGDQEGAKDVFGDDASGVAEDMGIACPQSQHRL